MFAHPAIFWTGLGAISAPIIIHLLNRRRFRMQPWAAMQFLLESLRKNRRRLQLEELILLLLRCLAVLMLALAAARFQGCKALQAIPGGQRVPQTVVFLLDDSYSMDQRHGAGTLFSAATADLAEQIKGMEEADKAYLLLASRVGQENAVLGQEGLADRVVKLKISDQRIRLPECLSAAGEILAGTTDDKVLVVLSDFRRVDLGAGSDQAVAIQRQFQSLEELGAKVVLMDYGREAKHNLTLESIELSGQAQEAKVAIANQPVRVALTVRNHSPTTLKNVEVRVTGQFKTGGEFREVAWPGAMIDSISSGRTRRIEHKVTCPEPGSAVIAAELPTDELAVDNLARLALDVRAVVRVLVVDGRLDATSPLRGESYAVTWALDPKSDQSRGTRVEVVGTDGLAEVRFDDYDFLILTDVSDFRPYVKGLQDYVRAGGGLVIFLGNHINTDFYNGPLYGEGAGLSPYRLLARVPSGAKTGAELRRTGKFYRLDPKSVRTDSVLRVFSGEASIMTSLIRFFAFTPADLHTQPVKSSVDAKPPIVLAKFDDPNGSPAVVARPYGRGTVLMFYTTASVQWHDWPTDPSGTFVVVMNDVRNYLTRARGQGLAARVGEPLVFEMMDKLPANASEVQRRRMLVETARVKFPKSPNTIGLKPQTRFQGLASQVGQVVGLMRKAGVEGATKIENTLKEAEAWLKRGQFSAQDKARRKEQREAERRSRGKSDNKYVEESLEELAADLAALQDSEEVKEALALPKALGRVRAILLATLRSDLTTLTRRELRYSRPMVAGVYSLTLLDAREQPIEEVLYARNPDPAEGDLRTSSREEIADAVGSTKFRYEQPLVGERKPRGIELAAKKEYWRWAVIAMLVILALESLLGQKFGHYTAPDSRGR